MTEKSRLLPSLADMAARVNALGFPQTVVDTSKDGRQWIYGLWYCGTGFQKRPMYGMFPMTFVKRVMAMFEGLEVLHLCCGMCHIDGAVNVDNRQTGSEDVVCDAEAVAGVFQQGQFDAVLIDPPYSEAEAEKYYGQKRLVRPALVFDQLYDVLVPGGYVAWLDECYPRVSRKKFGLVGLIGVVTGEQRHVRVLSIFRKLKFKEGATSWIVAQ